MSDDRQDFLIDGTVGVFRSELTKFRYLCLDVYAAYSGWAAVRWSGELAAPVMRLADYDDRAFSGQRRYIDTGRIHSDRIRVSDSAGGILTARLRSDTELIRDATDGGALGSFGQTIPAAAVGRAAAVDAGTGHVIATASDAGLPSGNPAALTVEWWSNNAPGSLAAGAFPWCWGTGGYGGIGMQYLNSTSLVVNSPNGPLSGTWTVPTFADAAWHFFALTYNGTAFSLTVDGVPYGAASVVQAPAIVPNLLRIGNWTIGSEPLNGALDELAIYNAVLSPANIAAHYAARGNGTYVATVLATPGLVRCYGFEEVAGTVCADRTGNVPATYGSAGVTLGVAGAVA